MNKKTLIVFGFGCLLSAYTLYMVFRSVPMIELWETLGGINYWWLVPTVVLLVSTFALRAYRWQIILKGVERVRFWQAFHPLMIGFMMNCILPLRVGELARPAILRRERGIAFSTGLATVAAERFFDMVVLLSLLAVLFGTITSQPDLDKSYFGYQLNSQTIISGAWKIIKLSVVLLVGITIVSFRYSRELVKRCVNGLARLFGFGKPGVRAYTDKMAGFVNGMVDNVASGLSMVREPHRLLACMGLTVLIWLITTLSYWVLAYGCPAIKLSLVEWTTVMVIICMVISLPSVPGFWGLWEAGGVFALALYGIMEKNALGYTLISHAIQVFPVIAIGLISAWITEVNILQLFRSRHMDRKAEKKG